MDPISIIGGGVCIAIVILAILLLGPKIREYNEQVAREVVAVQALVQSQGWHIVKPEKGDIKWVIHTPGWQLIYDSNSSSDSSTPSLQWIAPTPAEAKSRFVVLTEAGVKMMKHPFTRKAFDKLQGFANKLAHKKTNTALAQSNLPAQPEKAEPMEVFAILDTENEFVISDNGKKKLIAATSSHASLSALKNSDIPHLLSAVIANEKSHMNDNSERLAQFSTRIEIKLYTNRPTAEMIRSIVALGEKVVALKI